MAKELSYGRKNGLPKLYSEHGSSSNQLLSFADCVGGDFNSYGWYAHSYTRGRGDWSNGHQFINRQTGDYGSGIVSSDVHQGSTDANGRIGIAVPTPDFYYFADQTYHSGGFTEYGALDRQRFDYGTEPVWTTPGANPRPTWALTFRDDLIWWSDLRYERVDHRGRILGVWEADFDASEKPQFLRGKNSFWIIGNKGGAVKAVRFDGSLRADRDDYTTEPNTPLTVEARQGVLANDEYTYKAQVVLEKQPKNGTVQLNQDGSFTYTPNPGFTGYDDIYYFSRKEQSGATRPLPLLRSAPSRIGTPSHRTRSLVGTMRLAQCC